MRWSFTIAAWMPIAGFPDEPGKSGGRRHSARDAFVGGVIHARMGLSQRAGMSLNALAGTRLHWPINEYRLGRAAEGIGELLDG